MALACVPAIFTLIYRARKKTLILSRRYVALILLLMFFSGVVGAIATFILIWFRS